MIKNDTPICGYKGDPLCQPPDCQGACPPNKPDLRPEFTPDELAAIATAGLPTELSAALVAVNGAYAYMLHHPDTTPGALYSLRQAKTLLEGLRKDFAS